MYQHFPMTGPEMPTQVAQIVDPLYVVCGNHWKMIALGMAALGKG